MEPERARRILGLPDEGAPGASRGQVASAHARLRAHLVARDRPVELADLDRAAALLGFEARDPRWRRAGLIALILGGVALGIAGLSRVESQEPAELVLLEELPAEALAPARGLLKLELGPPGTSAVVVREGAVDQSLRVEADAAPVELEAGTYAVRASHPDCPGDDQRSVVLLPGEMQEVSLRACSDTGWVIVRSNVEDDALAVDGAPSGSSGPQALPLGRGEHTLRVEKEGYGPWQGAIEVLPGETLALRAELMPAPAGQAGGGGKEASPAETQEEPDDSGEEPAVAAAPGQASGGREGSERRPVEPADRWTRQVRQFLLRYDLNLSGSLDRESEIRAVPCDEWLGIEGSHDRSGLMLSFTRFYGFDGSTWKGSVLGIDPGVRRAAYERMRECGMR